MSNTGERGACPHGGKGGSRGDLTAGSTRRFHKHQSPKIISCILNRRIVPSVGSSDPRRINSAAGFIVFVLRLATGIFNVGVIAASMGAELEQHFTAGEGCTTTLHIY